MSAWKGRLVGRDGRMVLDKHRKDADFLLEPVARRFINVNPNTVSWLGLIVAFLSGVLLFFSWYNAWLLPLAAFAVLISGYFDALDGKIAKMAHKISVKGDYIDHVFDRYADMFMIAAIAVSGWCHSFVGLLAVMGVLLTSYMGTQAQAVGGIRLYAGLLGRADRVILCFVFPLIQGIACLFGYPAIEIGTYSLSFLEIMMVWFAIAGNYTAVERVVITWRALGIKEKPADEPEKKQRVQFLGNSAG